MHILVFFLVFTVLVAIHEFGHYLFARIAKMKVEEFGFGLPPRLAGIKKWGTLWSINALPIGGFVRVKGADESEVGKTELTDPDNYHSKSWWQRFWFLIGGVLMNFLLCWIILAGLFTVGTDPFFGTKLFEKHTDFEGIRVMEVMEDGTTIDILQPGDLITHVDEQAIISVEMLPAELSSFASEIALITVVRDDIEVIELEIPVSDEGRIGIGFAPQQTVHQVKLPLWKAIGVSAMQMGELTYLTVDGLAQMVIQRSLDGVTGPVGMVKVTEAAVAIGIQSVMKLAALLSLSLGVLNLLPFPALDGGRLLFLFVEGVIQRRIPAKFEMIIHGIGFLTLIIFMIIVTIRDINLY